MSFLRKLFHTTSYLLVVVHNTASHIATVTNLLHTTSKASFCSKPVEPSTSEPHSTNMALEFKYESGSCSVAFVTVPDENIAKKLAHGLVEQKLAACVNIIPQIQSIYMWEGKINEDNEYLMMIKTRTNHVEELTKWVRDNHPYSVAEVITVPIEKGNPLYMKWLAEVTERK